MAENKVLEIKPNESNYSFIINPLDFEPAEVAPKRIKLEDMPNINHAYNPNPILFENHAFSYEPDSDAMKMFVGQIPHSYTESDLLKMFEQFGKVYEIRLLKDKITGRSKGCCFVTFFTRLSALNAQYALHNIKVLPGMHHPIQMKPADTENRNDRKLFIGMLPKKYSEGDIRTLFSPYGTIEECTVLRDIKNQSKGCAFVTYMSRQSAQNAIKSMHHCRMFEGCSSPMVVKFADTQKDKEVRRMQLIKSNDHNLISSLLQQLSVDALSSLVSINHLIQLKIANCIDTSSQLKNPTTQMDLFPSIFSNYTANIQRLSDNLSPHNTLLGFNENPTFNETAILERFLSQLSEAAGLIHLPPGVDDDARQSSFIIPSKPPEGIHQWYNTLCNQKQIEGPKGANLFIYHLPQEYKDIDLFELFQDFGRVISAKVFIDKMTNLSKCFGFVSFSNVASAQAAIQALNGYHILGKRLKVELKKSK